MILITEVTGTVGVPLTGELPAGDAPFRALVRDPRRVARMLGPEGDFVEGDYERPETLHAALAGIERLFLIFPLTPRLADLEGRVIDAAVRVGVEHGVKLSTLGVLRGTEGFSSPEPRQYHLHRLSEGRLEIPGIAFTYLRPGTFMQNVLSFATRIAREDAFYGSWDDGRMGHVDVRDVADVAARVLTDDGHEHKAYGITGPEALSQAEVAEKLSASTG